jgi:aspartate-semialdehyde dehydrogenase
MPITSHKKDIVFVGRIRRDFSQEKTLNMWVVADNLRKGAATNTVQIAEYLVNNNLL